MKEIPSVISKIYARGQYEDFAKRLVGKLQRNISKLDIGKNHKAKDGLKLIDSFTHQLHYDSNRRVTKITISHKYAGFFVDLGVGRSLALEDIGYQKIGRSLLGRKVKSRRAKRWYLKTIYGQTIYLMSIVAKDRGDEYSVAISHALNNFDKIQINL